MRLIDFIVNIVSILEAGVGSTQLGANLLPIFSQNINGILLILNSGSLLFGSYSLSGFCSISLI